MEIMNLVLIALFIEGVVSALKPIWSKNGAEISVAELVSMAVGVVIAVACRLNMLEGVMQLNAPAWFYFVLYIMTGIAIGRGPNFLYDLWNRIKGFTNTETLIEEAIELPLEDDGDVDLNIENWPLEMIMQFAKENGFNIPDKLPIDPDAAKEYLIECMVGKYAKEYGNDAVAEVEETEPPTEGPAA